MLSKEAYSPTFQNENLEFCHSSVSKKATEDTGRSQEFATPFSFCFAGTEAELAMLSGGSVRSRYPKDEEGVVTQLL